MAYNFKNTLKHTQVGILGFQLMTTKHDEALWQDIRTFCQNLQNSYSIDNLQSIEGIEKVRTLFKQEGIDPLRYRPSSEALLRRILKRQELYHINSVVDSNNYCSLQFLLPMGVYDSDHIIGTSLVFRYGNGGESYQGIGKETLHAEGKIIFSDEKKICGGPISDSVETMITLSTKHILMVIYSPLGVTKDEFQNILDKCSHCMTTYNQGIELYRNII